jgi:hypothetical protein
MHLFDQDLRARGFRCDAQQAHTVNKHVNVHSASQHKLAL